MEEEHLEESNDGGGEISEIVGEGAEHLTSSYTVGPRVLSFFSSRRNWDSPNPSPAEINNLSCAFSS
jgi:hypothetical protein